MTAIFISHSSADNQAAARMSAWLEGEGHTSLFLDFDPETGIRAGSDWEETLYRKLRQCQAVIALLTPGWLASKWCFAELVQAREKGKAIFPVKVQPCDAHGVFSDIQHLDLTADAEAGYRRLAAGLLERGLDPADVFDWDPDRPLYPGLEAFKEADAAIFFGRSEETLNGLEALHALRRRGRGAPRLALFLGASGSGKSSLVRAGLIPRLRKLRSEWLPVAPFRPGDDPLAELALAVAHEFKALGHSRDWVEIQRTLEAAAKEDPPDAEALLTLARDLSETAGQREAMVVLTIDQAEELFGYCAADEATGFLRLLRAALEGADRRLMALATLRSDFIGDFQVHSVLHDPAYDHDFAYQVIPVDPMPERNFAQIIRGPARFVDLRFEDGLVEAMVSDTGSRDALPLLAFTLRRLYERYSEDGLLALREYEELGRLDGAIRSEAERVLTDAAPTPEDLDVLRAAFVPMLVRIDADGVYARRRAYADDENMTRAASLLERFVEARLLVKGRDKDGRPTLEIAHEALLRSWPQLTRWLSEDQDKLRLLQGLQRAADEWDSGGQQADLLVHRDGRLEEADALATAQRFALPEGSREERYLEACLEQQSAREASRREEQERRIRDAERIAREQKKTTQRTLLGLVAAIALALAAGWQYWIATKNANVALARQLGAQSQLAIGSTGTDLIQSGLLATESLERVGTLSGYLAWIRVVDLLPSRTELAHADVRAIALSADGAQVVSVGGDWALGVWDAITGELRSGLKTLRDQADGPLQVLFSPDSKRVSTLDADNTVRVWDVTSGDEVANFPHEDTVKAMVFSAATELLATASEDGTVRVWNVETGLAVGQLPGDGGVDEIAFNNAGTRLTIASWIPGSFSARGAVSSWDLGTDTKVTPVEYTGVDVPAKTLSPDGEHFAASTLQAFADFYVTRVWNVTTGEVVASTRDPVDFAFSPDGRYLVLGDVVRDLRGFEKERRLPSGVRISAGSELSPGGHLLAVPGDDAVRVWHLESEREVARLLGDGGVTTVAFSRRSPTVGILSRGSTVLWNQPAKEEASLVRQVRDWAAESPVAAAEETVSWEKEDLVDVLCARLPRNLTRSEWGQFLRDEPYRPTCRDLPVPAE